MIRPSLLKPMSWLLVVALATFSCKKDEEIVGNPPMADAGSPSSATVGSTVTLDGSNSSDPDGDPLEFSWQLTQIPGGSSASITNRNDDIVTFTPDVEGIYTATLTVEDGNGNADTDDVTITVTEAIGNPPVAVITDDMGNEFSDANGNNVVSVNSPVSLSGHSSHDPDSDPISYEWSLTDKPDGSSATFANNVTVTPEFTPDVAGEYTVSLTVDDGNGNKNTTSAVLTARISPVIIDEDVTENTTWENVYDDPSYPDYRITADIDVDAELTVDPGVYVEVVEDKFINVLSNGSLNAEGTSSDSIKFTSANIEGNLHWGGILFKSNYAKNKLIYTEISYAGNSDIAYINSDWRAAGVAVTEDGKLTVKNSRITNSKAYGLFIGKNLEAFESNVFEDNADYAMAIPFNQVGKIDENTDIQNNGTNNYIEIYSSQLADDQSMVALKNDQSYRVTGEIELNGQLNIDAGVKMVFDNDVYFRVKSEGTIIAEGTSSDHIIMTSSNTDAGVHWGGIEVNSSYSSNKLDYVEVTYAGESDMFYENSDWRSASIGISKDGKIAITNSLIANSKGEGIYAGANSLISFSDNEFADNAEYAISIEFNEIGKIDGNTTFTGNDVDGVRIYKSTLEDDQTINKLAGSAVYLFTGDAEIDGNLEISKGAELQFEKDVQMKVNSTGTLNAVGTSAEKIVLTSANQSADTHWSGLLFLSNSSLNELQYAEISYAGSDDRSLDYINSAWRHANIALRGAKLKLHDCTISNSDHQGIVIGNSSSVNGYSGTDTTPAANIEADNTFSSNGDADVLFL